MDWRYEKYAYSNTSLKVWLMMETAAEVLFFEVFACTYREFFVYRVLCITQEPLLQLTIHSQ